METTGDSGSEPWTTLSDGPVAEHPTPRPRSTPHRPWSTLLVAAFVVPLVAGVVALVCAVVFVVIGLATVPDEGPNEPYGLFIGAVLGVVGVPVVAVSALLTVLAVRGRRAADAGRWDQLTGVALTSVVAVGLLVTVSLLVAGPVGMVTAVLLLGPYAAPGIGVLRAARRG